MLDGLFDRHGFLHAQSRADARLDLHPQIQRLRIAPHHRRHQRGTVGRNPDPHRTDGRRGGAGHRGPLALQRRKRGIGRKRNEDETTPGANGRQDPSAGPELRRQALLGRNFRLHPRRRPAQAARRGYGPGFRLRHPHLVGTHLLGRQGQ